MPRIARVKLHKTPSGKIKSATIDMKKHGVLLLPLLQNLGAVEQEAGYVTTLLNSPLCAIFYYCF